MNDGAIAPRVRTPVKDGDEIRAGRTTFRVRMEADVAPVIAEQENRAKDPGNSISSLFPSGFLNGGDNRPDMSQSARPQKGPPPPPPLDESGLEKIIFPPELVQPPPSPPVPAPSRPSPSPDAVRPPAVSAGEGLFEAETCGSGLTACRGTLRQISAAELARRLMRLHPLHLIVDFKRMKRDVPKQIAAPDYLLDWLDNKRSIPHVLTGLDFAVGVSRLA